MKRLILLTSIACSCFGQISTFPPPSGGGGGALATVATTGSYVDLINKPALTGTNTLTANDTLLSSGIWTTNAGVACGNISTFNGSGLTATLSTAIPLSGACPIAIQNLNATALTVARNGLLLNGGTSNITLAQYQTVVLYGNGVAGWNYQPPISAGANTTLTWSATGLAINASASAPYQYATGPTAAVTMNSTDVAVYSVANVPALAAGSCYQIFYSLASIPGGTVKIKVDSITIATPITGSGALTNFTSGINYCNDQATQSTQRSSYILNQFNAAPSLWYSNVDGAFLTPTGVNWATTHTISVTVNTGAGTSTGNSLVIR